MHSNSLVSDNLRYTISYCLFGLENNTEVSSSPCIIE